MTATATQAFSLKTYKAGSLNHDGYVIDYSIQCPDGTVLHFHNDGTGGGDYCTHISSKRGKGKSASGIKVQSHVREFEQWCRTQPACVEFGKTLGDDPWKYSGAADIWVGAEAEKLHREKDILRTAKRCGICFIGAQGTVDYFKKPRGAQVTLQYRTKLIDVLLIKYPDVHTIYEWGGGELVKHTVRECDQCGITRTTNPRFCSDSCKTDSRVC